MGWDVQQTTSLRNLQRRSKNMAQVMAVAMKRTDMIAIPIICHVLFEWSVGWLSVDAGTTDGAEEGAVVDAVELGCDIGVGVH